MSAALPNCPVCLHPSVREIDQMIVDGVFPARIVRKMNGRRNLGINKGKWKTQEAPPLVSGYLLQKHRERCGEAVVSSYIPATDIHTPGGRVIPKSVSAAELADPTRRLDLLREALSSKFGELSAAQLYAMYMAEMKLQTAQAERASKGGAETPETPEDGDALNDAMAQAAGHLPDLRVVTKRKAS